MPFDDLSTLLCGVYCDSPLYLREAQSLAQQFNRPVFSTPASEYEAGFFVLVLGEQGVELQATGKKAPGPIKVDFVQGANAHRRQFGGGKGQMIAKAIGLKGAYRPHVLDVTAGLGQDAFVLATLGCQMTLVERSPIIYHLLNDGLERARKDVDKSGDNTLGAILMRIQSVHQHGVDYLKALSLPVDVVYLDPMFPVRNNKAEVNKNMKAFHELVGSDGDAGELLDAALSHAVYRVVVKRPRKAPTIGEQFPELSLVKPSLAFTGKSTRFDVYTLKKMP